MLAPIGTGTFFCNAASLDRLTPPVVGYNTVGKNEAHLDYAFAYRPGSSRFEESLINFPGIWGFDAATKLLLGLGTDLIERHILDLASHAGERLQAKGWTVASPLAQAERSGLVSFRSDKIATEKAAARLEEAGVDLAVRDGRLRISPSYYNTREDVDRLVDALLDGG